MWSLSHISPKIESSPTWYLSVFSGQCFLRRSVCMQVGLIRWNRGSLGVYVWSFITVWNSWRGAVICDGSGWWRRLGLVWGRLVERVVRKRSTNRDSTKSRLHGKGMKDLSLASVTYLLLSELVWNGLKWFDLGTRQVLGKRYKGYVTWAVNSLRIARSSFHSSSLYRNCL